MALIQKFHRSVVRKKNTILLIQSSETQGNRTKRHLEESGHEVIVAGTGLTDVMMATRETVDLIILDVALLDIEGLELCHRFRQRNDTRSTPIILLAAYGFLPNGASNSSYGPDAYLAKPYKESELDERITLVLETRAQAANSEETISSLIHKSESVPPTMVTMEQSATKPEKPDLKLILKRVTLINRKEDMASLDKPAAFPEKNKEGRLVLKTASSPKHAIPPSVALNSEPAIQQRMSWAGQQNEIGGARGSDLIANLELNSANATAASPILAFEVTGDAVIDPVTGLFGKSQFEVMFSKEFKRAVRFKQQMSCMLINLDGHALGRKADGTLVKAIIRLVQKTIRQVDTAAWWSGESFIVLLPNTTGTDALQAAARTLEAVATHPFTWPDATQVTMSIGVAGLPDKNIDSEKKMIEVAIMACQRAQEFAVPPSFDFLSLRR